MNKQKDVNNAVQFMLLGIGLYMLYWIFRLWFVAMPLIMIGTFIWFCTRKSKESPVHDKIIGNRYKSQTIHQWRGSFIRATKTDRDLALDLLKEALALEAITFDQYIDRTGQVVESVHVRELYGIVYDLPNAQIRS